MNQKRELPERLKKLAGTDAWEPAYREWLRQTSSTQKQEDAWRLSFQAWTQESPES
jgi:hypothetical protein